MQRSDSPAQTLIQRFPELYVGIMSGTSLDGVDAVLVDLAAPTPRLIASHYRPYPQALKLALLELHQPSSDELHRAQLLGLRLAGEYAQATLALLQQAGVGAQEVRAIGCHGQTVRHRPESGYSLQLNQPAWLAEQTGIAVVADFRSRDIAAGGQGAPLVPAFHDRIARHPEIHRAVLNIGGIANLTDLAPDNAVTGFDTGPGNLLLDAWIGKQHGLPYDQDGAWAASGQVLPALLAQLLQDPYFSALPPKSTGRDHFNLAWLERHLTGGEAAEDVQATLLALTTRSIAQALERFCPGVAELYLCGGGVHNRALVESLGRLLPHCRIEHSDVLGIAADWMEAMAFAWLAQQAMQRRPGNLPAVTGARHPCVLGAIYPA